MSTVTKLVFKDEDGSDENSTSNVSITPVENGYILSISDDEDEWQEVFMDKSELLKRIGELV